MKNYISKNGLDRLLKEQDYLISKERPQVTKVVTWAASLGDRSENADYQYGKKKLREIDRRLRFLKKRIESAVAIEPSKVTNSKIQFGATVTLLNHDEIKTKYTIAGVDEINLNKKRISLYSPIGKCLMGKEVGDTVEVQTPKGIVEYEILKIEYISWEVTYEN